jgi:glucose-1-phosphate adenylyltransferase
VLILSGDHIYKMDYSLFVQYHQDKGADLTISLLEVDKDLAGQFGIAEVDGDFRIVAFREKPKETCKPYRETPTMCSHPWAFMYLRPRRSSNCAEAGNEDDFGRDIIPNMLASRQVFAYPYVRFNQIKDYIYFTTDDGEREIRLEPRVRDSSYWRDVGTLDAYWNANMDLTGVDPYFNLYGTKWPIHTRQVLAPPAKFIFNNERPEGFRVGKALDSLVAPGCIISGIVRNSVLSYNIVVRSWATVDESVVCDDVVIGRNCRIKKAIIDKNNNIPPHTEIGYNPNEDRKRFTVTPRGIVVVPKGYFGRME